MALTDMAIRNAKPGVKPIKISDSEGLQLHVMPNGSKLWRLAYRFGGKQKQLALGSYPAVDLLTARRRREEAKDLLRGDVDPSVQKRINKIAQATAAALTFNLVADELIAKHGTEKKAPATLAKVRWLIDFARPALGDRPLRDISAAEVLAVLRTVEVRGRHETAKRLRATIGQVFRYGVATARADNDPTLALRGALTAPQVTHRPAITDPKAFGGLLRAIAGYDGQPTTKAALQLMALLFQRPGELRMAEWSEFKLDEAVWVIPASRAKMRREHRVPLPTQALAILRGLHIITGGGKLAFPAVGSKLRPISENTLNGALRRLGYAQEAMTAHGFRASASTMLNESGKWSRDAIERALAHVEENAVRKAYARGEHWDERVSMSQWWADKLDALREGKSLAPMFRIDRVTRSA